MDYRYLTAPCGKDCFNCPLYIGEENKENREKFLASRNIPPDKYKCKGCRAQNGHCEGLTILGINPECKTFNCVKEKNVEFCYECGDFPCFRLQPVADRAERVPHALKIFNLCMIKKEGIENWAREHSKQVFLNYYSQKLGDCM
ncbi:MAG: DUF3795 domain-containing protein [Bacteroidales bacterium]